MIKKIKAIWNKYEEVINYLFWGGVAFFLSMGLFNLFVNQMNMEEQFANTMDWVICVIFAYFTNRLFVFKSRSTGTMGVGREVVSFIGARVGTLILENLILFVAIDLLMIHNMLAKLMGQFAVIIGNYVLSKLWIFRK